MRFWNQEMREEFAWYTAKGIRNRLAARFSLPHIYIAENIDDFLRNKQECEYNR